MLHLGPSGEERKMGKKMKGFGPICETTASGNRAEFPLPQNCADSCASVAAVFSAATPTGLLVNWGKRGQRKETKGRVSTLSLSILVSPHLHVFTHQEALCFRVFTEASLHSYD